jgi:hypothetical protein
MRKPPQCSRCQELAGARHVYPDFYPKLEWLRFVDVFAVTRNRREASPAVIRY